VGVPNSAWSSSVSVSSRAVASGKNVTFTSIFQNPTSAVVIVNFEVYDSHGTRVYQSASSNIFVAAGEHKISRPWTVPYGTVAGGGRGPPRALSPASPGASHLAHR